MNSTRFSRRSADRTGAALLIVLSLVVLLTALVATYLSWAISQRQVADSSGNQTKSELFARGALDIITGGLQQEIANGSVSPPSTIGGTTVYLPSASANIMPVRITSVGGTYQRKYMPSLLRESVRSDAIASPAVPSLASACNSTTDASLNGRKISLARWNAHCLLAAPNIGTGSTGTGDRSPYSTVPTTSGNPNTAVASSFTPPDWVFVSKSNGPEALTAPDSSVIGRYAYVVYDEGGLLDVNTAGFPELTSFTATTTTYPQQIGLKGSIAFADLTQITALEGTSAGVNMPQSLINQIVGLRNYGTMVNSSAAMPTGAFPSYAFTGGTVTTATFLGNYTTNIITNVNGFMKVNAVAATSGQTDQAILSRQQLINLIASTGTANCGYLPYLGTFSRAVNAPSWSPPANASTFSGGSAGSPSTAWTGNNGTPAIYAYKDNADISTGSPFSTSYPNPNRNLPNVRFPAAGTVIHYDDNGNPIPYGVNAGDPLLQHRFSLAKLAWVTFKGPSASLLTSDPQYNAVGTAANVQACFGLQWNSGSTSNGQPYYRWEYVGPTGSTTQTFIETLDQVGNSPSSNSSDSSPREPNFFELLKAGLLSGSLGRDPGPGVDQSITSPTRLLGAVGVIGGFYPPGGPSNYKSATDLQTLQIGVNIIDQTSVVSFPTAIHLQYWGTSSSPLPAADELSINTVYGDKNLPCLHAMVPIELADPIPTGSGATITKGSLYGWFVPYLWNPHQVPTSTLAGSGGNLYPTKFRAHAYGAADTDWFQATRSITVPNPDHLNKTIWDDGTGNDASAGRGDIYFLNPADSTSPFYNNPQPLNLVTTTGVLGTGGTAIVQVATSASTPPDTTPLMNSYNLDPTNFHAADLVTKGATWTTSNPFVGFSLAPDTNYGPDSTKASLDNEDPTPDSATPASFSLQYKGPDGFYHPYNFWSRVSRSSQGGKLFRNGDFPAEAGWTSGDGTGGGFSGWGPEKADPRTDRFSASNCWFAGSRNSPVSTMNPGNAAYSGPQGSGAGGSGDYAIPYISLSYPFTYIGGGGVATAVYDPTANPTPAGGQIELFMRNDANYVTPVTTVGVGPFVAYYADPDGVVRYGDGYRQGLTFTSTWSGDGSQLYIGNASVTPAATLSSPGAAPTATVPGSVLSRRPVILNRPFRSVGEMGFAFRDDPCKTLDFWSQYSGDAALLDLFSVTDQPTVIAGQINPYSAFNFAANNSSVSPVLQALLSGTVKSDSLAVILNANTASPTDLTTLGKKLVADMGSNGPYANRSELATRMGPVISDPHNASPAFNITQNTSPTIYSNWANKAYAEAPMRALVDVTNTRTWNIMIDVVAQTGKFSPTAPATTAGLANFVVQGETHYWLHVAIDRFTGKVIDQRLEPVYE